MKSTAAGQAPKFLGFGTNHPILLPASSGVSFGGGPGGAGVKTHGSDVVEVASATSLHNLTSILTSTRKNDAFSHHACDDTILNVVLAPKVWRHPHHVHVVNRVCLRLGDGERHLSLSLTATLCLILAQQRFLMHGIFSHSCTCSLCFSFLVSWALRFLFFFVVARFCRRARSV